MMSPRVMLVASITLIAMIAGSACKDTKQPPVGVAAPTDTAEQTGFNVRTLLTGNGVQRGELQADTMYV